MHEEAWLRPNRRPAMVGFIGSGLAAVGAAQVLVASLPWDTALRQSIGAGAVVAGLIAVALGVVVWTLSKRARIIRRNGEVVFRLRTNEAIAVPLEIVEAFFLGQGPAHLPAAMGQRLESVNLVARLAQRATEWHSRQVDPRLGAWCDGYITIRGTHCEPLNTEIIHRLNRQLAEAKQCADAGGCRGQST